MTPALLRTPALPAAACLLAAWRLASLGAQAPAGPAAQGFAAAPDRAAAPAPAREDWTVSFVDVARQAGLRDEVVYGGQEQKRFIIETNGAGVALVDVAAEGWLDALLASEVSF